jgi:hypothetical protein
VIRAGAAVLAVILLSAGCRAEPPPEPPPVALAWQESALPVPAGGAGALSVRDAAACGGTWFEVGAVRDPAGGTRPAAWTSADGVVWTSLNIAATTFYGEQNVLAAVACRDGLMAAVGAKTGGVHGNPRTSSWRWSPGGPLREVTGSFELFGGPDAVNVGRLAAGPNGFLISGNRVTGAAVWVSRDASRFDLREGAPGLASDAAGETWAYDGAAVSGAWLVVGGVRPPGRTDRDPMGWRSADGRRWVRLPAEGASAANEELQRVVVLDGVPLGVGVSGPAFGLWRLDGARWRPAGSFGEIRQVGASAVAGLAVAGGRLFCITSDGSAYRLWASPDGSRWDAVAMPAPAAVSPGGAVALAGVGGGRLVLVIDDGAASRSFSALVEW